MHDLVILPKKLCENDFKAATVSGLRKKMRETNLLSKPYVEMKVHIKSSLISF